MKKKRNCYTPIKHLLFVASNYTDQFVEYLGMHSVFSLSRFKHLFFLEMLNRDARA